jgi:hypothetical protein
LEITSLQQSDDDDTIGGKIWSPLQIKVHAARAILFTQAEEEEEEDVYLRG